VAAALRSEADVITTEAPVTTRHARDLSPEERARYGLHDWQDAA
jgi:hypothetical protein